VCVGGGEGVRNKVDFLKCLGLGGVEKRKEVHTVVQEKRPFILCLKITKLQLCDVGLATSLWGDPSCFFSFRPSQGASGGILSVWDTAEVEVWSSVSCDHTLIIHGRFIKSNEEFYLFNIYAPCDVAARKLLWDSLSVHLQQLRGKKVCVCGDFNDVQCREQRQSVNVGHFSSDFSHFNSFIGDNFLFDLPLGGRNYTWFKGDGKSMSQLDQFLQSEEWCLLWLSCLQIAQLRGLSDHYPLVLSVDEENWGPRPSRLLKCWTDIPGYNQFVSSKWKSFQVHG